jgi:hypothetical protein
MGVDHTAARERNGPVADAKRAGSKVATPMIFIGCLVINVIPMATAANAHVKWFVPCDSSEQPLPLRAVFTPTFCLLSTLFVALFFVACRLEQTTLGATLSSHLDRWTGQLHLRTDDLLRAAAAVSFALLWADGGVILTPELKGSSTWLSAIQVLIATYLFARATLPAAACGVFVLYGLGVATYGLFHMLDYPVFLGIGAYFALSASRNPRLLALRLDCLRWTVALTLLWPSMEKFLYPEWIAPIAAAHPQLTLGVDVATFITAAGVVEFGLAFALFWTPLVRRLAALALTLLLVAAMFEFGKTDGIGHLMIVAILLVVVADPGRQPVRHGPALAPLVSGVILLAMLLLYSGAHTLYYGSWHAAVVPLISGAALLTLGLLYLHGLPPALLSTVGHLSQRLISDRFWRRSRDAEGEAADEEPLQHPAAFPMPVPVSMVKPTALKMPAKEASWSPIPSFLTTPQPPLTRASEARERQQANPTLVSFDDLEFPHELAAGSAGAPNRRHSRQEC